MRFQGPVFSFLRLFVRPLFGVLLLFSLASCDRLGTSKKPTLWIYTSLYKEVIAELNPLLKESFPDASIEWFQGGSETIASKVSAELASGRTKAVLLLTSDPFWYLELKKAGRLLPYESEAAKKLAPSLRDPEHTFVTSRLPLMVMGYHPAALAGVELPKKWTDLTHPRFKSKVAMASPLESGTAFTWVATIQKDSSPQFLQDLRNNDILAAGGNSAVLQRIESKERPLGIILLENLLAAQKKGSPVQVIYPEDGSVPIYSPIAISKSTAQPELAKRVYDWFLSEKAQGIIVKSGMYSPLSHISAPAGAKPWNELSTRLKAPSQELLAELFSERDQLKSRFRDTVLK